MYAAGPQALRTQARQHKRTRAHMRAGRQAYTRARTLARARAQFPSILLELLFAKHLPKIKVPAGSRCGSSGSDGGCGGSATGGTTEAQHGAGCVALCTGRASARGDPANPIPPFGMTGWAL